MAELLGSAFVEVRADTHSLPSELGGAERQFDQFLEKMKRSSEHHAEHGGGHEHISEGLREVGEGAEGAKRQIEGFFDALKEHAMELLPFASLAAGVAATAREFEKSTEAARDSENEQRKLAAVLTATGYAAGFTKEQLNEMKEPLMAATGQTAISNMQATLLTFRNVQGKVFEDASRAALGMSAIYGTDLTMAARMVGIALDNPLHGMERLRKVGVSFSDEQKKQIKNFIAMHDVTGAQNVMLEEFARKFPMTTKALEEATSPIKRAEGALHAMREELGAKLLPAQIMMVNVQKEFVHWLSISVDIVADVVKKMTEFNESTGGWALAAAKGAIAAGALVAAITMIAPLVTAAASAIGGFLAANGWFIAAGAVGAFLAGMVKLVPLQEAWERAVNKARVAWDNISSAVSIAFEKIIVAVNSLMVAMGFKGIVSSWRDLTEGMSTMITDACVYMIDQISNFIIDASEWAVVLSKNWELIWNTITLAVQFAFSRMQDLADNFVPFLVESFAIIGDAVVRIFEELPTAARDVLNYMMEQLNSFGQYGRETFENWVTTAIKVLYHLPNAMLEIAEMLTKTTLKMAASLTANFVKGVINTAKLALQVWTAYGKSIIDAISGKDAEKQFERRVKAVKDTVEKEEGKISADVSRDLVKEKKESALKLIKDDISTGLERERKIKDDALNRAAAIPLGSRAGISNIWKIAADAADALKGASDKLLKPSDRTTGLASDFLNATATAITKTLRDKADMEAKRPGRISTAAFRAEMLAGKEKSLTEMSKDLEGKGVGGTTSPRGKEVEGFFGPLELSKKIQEAVLKDKTDREEAIKNATEGTEAAAEGARVGIESLVATFKAAKPIMVATA